MRQQLDPAGAEEPDERRPETVERGIAAGQGGQAAVPVPGDEPVDGVGEPAARRRRPRDALGGDLGRQQVELPAAAEHDLGRDEGRSGPLRQAGPAVGADADDRNDQAFGWPRAHPKDGTDPT